MSDTSILELKKRLDNLQRAFEQSQRNQVPLTAKTDDASGAIPQINEKIDEITPYTVTKTAYIEDTEITFTDVPDGTMSVFVKDSEGNYPDFTVSRSGDMVQITFEPLETVTTVTISVL